MNPSQWKEFAHKVCKAYILKTAKYVKSGMKQGEKPDIQKLFDMAGKIDPQFQECQYYLDVEILKGKPIAIQYFSWPFTGEAPDEVQEEKARIKFEAEQEKALQDKRKQDQKRRAEAKRKRVAEARKKKLAGIRRG